MGIYESLKSVWKKLGINGQVKNFSNIDLGVIETDSTKPIARKLKPGFKTPITTDVDGFKRTDGIAIEGHKNWWKFYDISTVEIYGKSKNLYGSAITKTAVNKNHFGKPVYLDEYWGDPIQLITDVKRNKKKEITHYFVTSLGWVNLDKAFRITCFHEIDNARPVFPKSGDPYIRTRRDPDIFNNISTKGLV